MADCRVTSFWISNQTKAIDLHSWGFGRNDFNLAIHSSKYSILHQTVTENISKLTKVGWPQIPLIILSLLYLLQNSFHCALLKHILSTSTKISRFSLYSILITKSHYPGEILKKYNFSNFPFDSISRLVQCTNQDRSEVQIREVP